MLLGRLLRVFRVLRLVSVIPELRVLIDLLLKAIPRMGFIAMLKLFGIFTFEEWTDIMHATLAMYQLSWIYYPAFIFLTAFVFLNMITGSIQEAMVVTGLAGPRLRFNVQKGRSAVCPRSG